MTIKKFPPFAKTYCCLLHNRVFWHSEHLCGGPPEVGWKDVLGHEPCGAPGRLYRDRVVCGTLRAVAALQNNWKSDDLPTGAVSAGCSAWCILSSKTQHKKPAYLTHEYELYHYFKRSLALLVAFQVTFWVNLHHTEVTDFLYVTPEFLHFPCKQQDNV